ncbi:MAG: acetoacetate--CoA ligase [Proteobacteria bacterium]|nr:acetoacetate--CoA ligase [Pseudomonadota bacterium]
MTDSANQTSLWQPSAQRIRDSKLSAFVNAAGRQWDRSFDGYADLHAWSVEHPEQFWASVWDFAKVQGERGGKVLVDGEKMPGAQWFPEARLNYAQNLLRARTTGDAMVFWGEDKFKQRCTHDELYRQVAHLAAALRALGVVSGDRVAAYLPNLPETIIAMLAAASIGAIFTSASPDFGIHGVLDRFGQIEPKVLLAADGYYYNGKTIDILDKVAAVAAQLPSLERVLIVPYVRQQGDLSGIRNALPYADFIEPFRGVEQIEFAQLPFAHPLYIMYSSGTTGVPKCIVHCAGGALLQHLKEHQLHSDIRPGDRLFYFTTCGWMMLTALRAMFSTGSPLVAESFEYVYRNIKQDLQLASISGGTDIVSCFVLGNPTAPVWRGEIQCAGLGMAVAVFDEQGKTVCGEKGELVCTRPFPVMPIGFWNDADGRKYHAAYFQRFANVGCHGDFAEGTGHGGVVIYGRSDATLNPGGVRIGTAEIYRQVEKLDEVVESLVIGQNWPPQDPNDVRVVLFVKLRERLALDDGLVKRIKEVIRDNTTPRHVPAKVLQVADIPRTKSGKIVELAVRNVVHGEAVKNLEALANPEALEYFRQRAELME